MTKEIVDKNGEPIEVDHWNRVTLDDIKGLTHPVILQTLLFMLRHMPMELNREGLRELKDMVKDIEKALEE